MTLIAVARTPDGIVIHADSKETVGDYHVQVDKIKSEKMGEFQVLIAGAGSPSTLIDAFPVRLIRKITSKVTTLEKFASVAAKELVRFYENDVFLCPENEKNVTYLIAAYHPRTRRFQAWTADNILLQPIPQQGPRLIGWEHSIYVHIAARFYSPMMSVPQAILAGVYLLSIGEETSAYIGGPIKIAVVNENGISLDDTNYPKVIQDRLKEYELKANQVFLDCADTTLSLPALEDSLNEFRQAALDLHRGHIDELATKATLLDFVPTNPLRKLPYVPLLILDDGKLSVKHDRESIDRARELREANRAWVKEHGIEFLTKPIQCFKCRQSFEAKIGCGGPFGHQFSGSCPNCGEGYEVEWEFESGTFS